MRNWWTAHKDRLGKASSRGTAVGGDPSDIRTAIGELIREKDTGCGLTMHDKGKSV